MDKCIARENCGTIFFFFRCDPKSGPDKCVCTWGFYQNLWWEKKTLGPKGETPSPLGITASLNLALSLQVLVAVDPTLNLGPPSPLCLLCSFSQTWKPLISIFTSRSHTHLQVSDVPLSMVFTLMPLREFDLLPLSLSVLPVGCFGVSLIAFCIAVWLLVTPFFAERHELLAGPDPVCLASSGAPGTAAHAAVVMNVELSGVNLVQSSPRWSSITLTLWCWAGLIKE